MGLKRESSGLSQIGCSMLSFCVMATIYLRKVPDDVAARLARLAARERISLNTLAVRELELVARRADNPELLADLPDTGVDAAEVVADVESGRPAP